MRIVFVLFPGVTQLDFTGPAQVLSRLPGAELCVAAKSHDPVMTDCGFAIVPTHAFRGVSQADLICVPGGFGVVEALGDEEVIVFIRQQALAARYVTSVCTGAFLLGAAGLLEGKRATTHWAYTDLLPIVGATHEPARAVKDGRIITGGGVTAGLDFALAVAAEVAGEETAKALQLGFEYDPAPPFQAGNPGKAGAAIRTLVEPRYEKPVAEMRAGLERLS